MDTLGADTGVGGLAALLESSVIHDIVRRRCGGQKRSVYAYLFLR